MLEQRFNDGSDLVQQMGWKEVVSSSPPELYDWHELRIYYSFEEQRYYWFEDAGCSCSTWGDEVHTVGEFCQGDKQAARRALEKFGAGEASLKTLREFRE